MALPYKGYGFKKYKRYINASHPNYLALKCGACFNVKLSDQHKFSSPKQILAMELNKKALLKKVQF